MEKTKTKFKQTEIGEIPEDWEVCVFSQAVAINPLRKLKKGVTAKKVSMQNLQKFRRKIAGYEIAKFNGGTKFKNNDTLMARITPCLENGKTSYVDILDKDEIGFGSTEFNVFCGKDGKTTDRFAYYLAISPSVRAEAINSMVGTSGRQRVQSDIFDSILISIPSIIEQEAIAKVLSDLDSKIELNQQMNKTLEATGQALFKRWFVNFEFPNENGEPYKTSGGELADSELGEIPKGWKVCTASEILEIQYGKDIRTTELLNEGYPVYGGNGIIGYYNEYLFKIPRVIISCRGAASGKVLLTRPKSFVTHNSLVMNIKETCESLNYHYLKRYCENSDMLVFVTGSTQPQITIEHLNRLEILYPSEKILRKFSQTVALIDNLIYENELENVTLGKIRDSLLPRLMSGRITI